MSATIRMASDSDAAAIAAIYGPFVRDTAISFEVVPPTAEEIATHVRKLTERFPWLVCAGPDGVVGYAYASPHRERAAYRWSVDVSVYIDPRAHRQGVGRALYTALLGIVTRQGYRTAYAGITLPNAGSIGLHEAMGFVPVAIYRNVGYKLGAWRDVGWWERVCGDYPTVPDEPAPVGALRAAPDWQDLLSKGLPGLRL